MSDQLHQDHLEDLLDYIRANRGFDFSGYKRNSLVRRISKRMQALEVDRYDDYIPYLEAHPAEFQDLFNTILINVTSFFRDPKAWEVLHQEVLPTIIERRSRHESIRVWVAGCATGEETYSIAMLLAERMGMDRFREQVKIYSTDLDDDALTIARQATYDASAVENISPELRDKYFESFGAGYSFNKDLRRMIIFGRHDLVQDAPISRVDLLLCRNVLMYFNAETQARVLTRLNYALANNGYLFVGKAEMLLSHNNLFTPVNMKYRIFRKGATLTARERMAIMANKQANSNDDELLTQQPLHEAVFDAGPIAQVVLDAQGRLSMANARAREQFGLIPLDIGKPFQDLELSYRPAELRSSIEQAYERKSPISIDEVRMLRPDGTTRFFKVVLTPMADEAASGISISFQDVSAFKDLEDQLKETNQELETAMEELQSTNEELETTNEELQSTIEELETTNEELQSTNEELETMNEELQSTNEELETTNDEMTLRTDDLNKANNFLETILTGMRGSVIVVDQEMIVQVWNRRAEDMWGLRDDETIGHNLLSLDFGLPVDEIIKPIREVVSGELELLDMQVMATNRRGRAIRCRVTCNPLYNNNHDRRGAILVVEQAKETLGESTG